MDVKTMAKSRLEDFSPLFNYAEPLSFDKGKTI